jgi:hypothetical protein
MTFTDASAAAFLQLLFTNLDGAGGDTDTAFTTVGSGLLKAVTPGSLYISLHTADPGITGNQSTSEVSTGSYGAYARVGVARSAQTNGTTPGWKFVSPNKIENTAVVTFPQKNNSGTATITWAGVGTDSSGAGNLLFRCPLSLDTPHPFVVEEADKTSNEITTTGTGQDTDHGYLANDQVVFIDVEGGQLPAGITEGTVYFVMSSPTDNIFKVSTASGDSGPVDITSSGCGLVAKVVPKTITQNDIFEIAASALGIFIR